MPINPQYATSLLNPEGAQSAEKQRLVKQLLGAGVSGLEAVANTLDLPASIVRDFLAGEGVLGSLDQVLSPFSSDRRTSGREILQQYGLASDEPNWGNFLGGLALEIGTDPLLGLGLGKHAVTGLGRAAGAAGLLERLPAALRNTRGIKNIGSREAMAIGTLRDLFLDPSARLLPSVAKKQPGMRGATAYKDLKKLSDYLGYDVRKMLLEPPGPENPIDQPLRGLFSYFGKPIGVGSPTTRKILRAEDAIASAIGRGPLGKAWAAVTSYKSIAGRAAAKRIRSMGMQTESATRAEVMRLRNIVDESIASGKIPNMSAPQFNAALRGFLENVSPYNQLMPQEFDRIFETVHGMNQQAFLDAHRKGVPIPNPAEDYNIHRQSPAYNENISEFEAHDLKGVKARMKKQQKIFRRLALQNWTMQTVGINRLFQDKDINAALEAYKRGRMPKADVRDIFDQVDSNLALGIPEWATDNKGRRVERTEILNSLISLGVNTSSEDRLRGIFPRDPLYDHLLRIVRQRKTNEAAGESLDEILRTSVSKAEVEKRQATFGPEHAMTIGAALKKLKLKGGQGFVPVGDMPLGGPNGFKNVYLRTNKYGTDALHPLLELGDTVWVTVPGSGRNVVVKRKNLLVRNRDGALNYLMDLAGRDPVNPEMWKNLSSKIRNRWVDGRIVEDLARAMHGNANPYVPNVVVRAWDSGVAAWKAMQLGPWPAFHSRNYYSGQYVNWATGMFSFRSIGAAHRFMQRGDVTILKEAPIFKRILQERQWQPTQENIRSILEEFVFADELFGGGMGDVTSSANPLQLQGGAGAAGVTDEGIGRIVKPAEKAFEPKEIGATFFGQRPAAGQTRAQAALQFWKTRGVGGRTTSEYGPVKAGEAVSTYVEGMNRLGPYFELLLKGVDHFEAAKRVRAAQVDYSAAAFSPIENEFLTRVFPFYRWTSRMLPFTVEELATRPGGRMAQTIRAEMRLRGDDETGYVPERVKRGIAVPLPSSLPRGHQRFLSQIDLPFEGALEPIQLGTNVDQTIQNFARGIAGNLNPAAQLVIETMTGQNLYTNRSLRDLEGGIDQIVKNLMMQSNKTLGTEFNPDNVYVLPRNVDNALQTIIGRPVYTARTLTDPRGAEAGDRWLKTATNLLTGAKITDIDVDRARSLEIDQRLANELLNDPLVKRFIKVYVPKEKLPTARPRTRMMLEMLDENRKIRRQLNRQKVQQTEQSFVLQ